MLGNLLAEIASAKKDKSQNPSIGRVQNDPTNKQSALSNMLGNRLTHPSPSKMIKIDESPSNLPLKEDPKYAKYFRMLKMHMPIGAVKNAMTRDGLNPDILDMDHNTPASCFISSKKKEIPKKKDNFRRARLRWNSLSNFIEESIWGKISDDVTIKSIDIDEDEFLDLFQAEIGTVHTKKVQTKKKMGVSVRVIDPKRANNGGITLARLKLNHDEMVCAIDRMEDQLFTEGQIENVIEYLPTKEEQEKLDLYMLNAGEGEDLSTKFDELCECEKFMVSMMTVPYVNQKFKVLLFKLQFQSTMESIADDADTVNKACDEVRNSDRLRTILGIVLEIGNRLNSAGHGTNNAARAYSLDSLLKLNQTKAFDKKTTFLHYIVLIVKRNDELLLKRGTTSLSVLNFVDDLPTVVKAEKVHWDHCVWALEDVEKGLENLRRMALHEAQANYGLENAEIMNNDSDIVLTLEEEVGALRSTQTGRFTLDAIRQFSLIHDKVDSTMEKFQHVLEYFGQGQNKSEIQKPHQLFAIFSQFFRDFGKAKEEKKLLKR